MPMSSAIRPMPKVTLPHQSMTTRGERVARLVVQRAVAHPGAPHADRHAHPEHRAPVPLGQHAADDQADERAGQRRHLVDAEGEAAPVGREGVGDDRGGVGHQHRAADALHDAHDDDLERAGPAAVRHDRAADRAEVKIRKPRLNSLARPYWSPSRPNVTTSTAVTSRKPISIHSR